MLSGHGLEVALQSIIAGAPVPVRVTVALEGRLPEQVEVAAFYVVSESLANIGKHARVAIGVGGLPFNAPVEIEAELELA